MAAGTDFARQPCPDRILDDLGGAFGMGCVGGFLFHFGRGLRHFPRGEKLAGAFYSARMRAPVLGGNFAVWGGTFSAFDCAFQYMRGKDDFINAIGAGAMTGGCLAFRGGLKSMGQQALIGGVLLAAIEGVMGIFGKMSSSQTSERDEWYKMKEQYDRAREKEKIIADPVTTGSSGKDGSRYKVVDILRRRGWFVKTASQGDSPTTEGVDESH